MYLRCCDSRAGMLHLAMSNTLLPGCVFFYLDAHWYDWFDGRGWSSFGTRYFGDLPLAEEVQLAFRYWPEAVVMVDDFAVPDDPGYGFDDHGAGECLNLEYLIDNDALPDGIWFPRDRSDSETGSRRGCVVLAHAGDVVRRIDTLTMVRRWTGDTGRRSGGGT
jgi:hypothetical protein